MNALKKDKKGYTFLEVVIAMLLVAIISSAVFSVALTARGGSGRNTRRLVADQASRQLAETLKNYVTADKTENTIIKGPGGGSNRWSMTNSNVGIADSCDAGGGANCYALQAGSHTITGLMPGWFENSYNGQLIYFVDYPQGGMNMPRVSITVDWDEPQG